MTQVFYALCQIHRQPKTGPLTEMKGFDPEGNAIVRATSEVIQPRQLFEESDPNEARWLVENEAARPATENEIDLWNKTEGAR